ncbi:MAG: DNA internalization-related competence protein ComEC/Rec2 [Clostridiaceae bacterium]|nr:DNA internalization-related competence protein ComEC/Rec2 [Clostridiaceae bacterium]
MNNKTRGVVNTFKRPMLWVFALLFIFFLSMRFFSGTASEKSHYILDDSLFGNTAKQVTLNGKLKRVEEKTNASYLYLKEISLTLSSQEETVHFSDFLVIAEKTQSDSLLPGSFLAVSGSLCEFSVPTNPGQFNEKSFYRQKNIFYKVYADQIVVTSANIGLFSSALLTVQRSLEHVYKSCLSEQDAGIILAMLLGNKSFLDGELKDLYTVNGIGHILAVSGLHVSILCAILMWLLNLFPLPKPVPFVLTAFFLFFYGSLTGFSVSASRAVIMMLMLLFAREIGRSYDGISAMSFSAVITLLQNPEAILSGSFLLSYGAVAGIFIITPALKIFFCGTQVKQNQKSRLYTRRKKEYQANYGKYAPKLLFQNAMQKLLSMLLASLGINLMTLPVLLYFYYEIPLYSILLNLFILPLAGVLMVFALAGGAIGLFCIPAGALLLSPVHWILCFYEKLCSFFLTLPGSIQVFGCPALWKILIFYLIILFLSVYLSHAGKYQARIEPVFKIFASVCVIAVAGMLLYRPAVQGLQVILLDVGQGDGILIRTEGGLNILVDGGSSDTSEVGKYRILPCLKYYGIRQIDYMLMTHEDEDHISGQLELMSAVKTSGVSVQCLLMPEPAKEATGDNYVLMQQTAQKAGIPVRYITAGDKLQNGMLQLSFLHPEQGFAADSANAYSVTASLTYGEISMLFTGDLEKNGEDALLELLQSQKTAIPDRYTFLKVAHHGSKNSTSEELLSYIRPAVAGISCAKNNRYGHPHRELLERLSNAGSKIVQTCDSGAIFLETEGKTLKVRSLKETLY